HAPLQVDHADLRAALRLDHGISLARLVGRVVRRPDQPGSAVDVGDDLLLAPDVVPAGDDVDARLEQLVGLHGHEPAAPGQILAVGDYAVDELLAAVLADALDDDRAAGLPDHVADCQDADFHRAYSTNRLSRITVTRISPGYVSCCSI